MRKWKRKLTGWIIGTILVVLASITWLSIEMPWVKATAGVVNSSGVYTIPGTSGSLGSSGNPFVVLEIVPNEKMAQFGYLVDGQEPIDLFSAMGSTSKAAVASALNNYMTISLTNNTVVKQEFVTVITDQDWANYYWNFSVNADQYGYYERLSDRTGNYDLTLSNRTVTDPVTLTTKTVYDYAVTPVTAGSGYYKWVGYTYAASTALTDTSTYLNTVTSDTVLAADSSQLKKIYGKMGSIAVYNAYNGAKVNKELFKKYALGLVYRDNDISKGEDSSAYEFSGWYKEPQCVNAYNSSDKVTSNITLYAKWKTVYSGGTISLYGITFNPNAGADGVLHLPDPIQFLNSGDAIVKPDRIPLRNGYLFTGWYKDAACTETYDFTKAVTANATAYAGWAPLSSAKYKISFNANAGAGNAGTVTNLPVDIADVLQNGRTAAYTSIEPLTPPARSNYVFAGWYWNSACTNPFAFDEPIPSGVTSTTIQLYARWIPTTSTTTYKISFNGNKPSKALSSVTGVPASLTGLTYGQDITTTFPVDAPYLKGNIVEKLKNYHVSVITVTPKDFTNQIANLGLIDRANLIVMNQTSTTQMQTFWTSFKNTELFSKPASQYNLTATAFTENDLSWAATLRLMNKITGLPSTTMCPVIYDYSIYQSVIASTSSSIKTTVSFNSTFSDSGTFSSGNVSGYSSNVYKLYLMTQQFNPVTLHNAYIATSKFDSSGNFTNIGSSYTNARQYWNEYTLLPYSVLSSSDWNSTTKIFAANSLEVLGIKRSYTLPAGKGLINNRLFLYQSSDNLVTGFMTPQLESADHSAMNNYFHPGGGTLPDRYTTAEGIYYMLHNTGLYTNFNKSLNILEVEPSDSFKNSSFWFWYISRYVPNFTGTYNVTSKNSSEFIGDIDDLNSQYDVIYLGVDATNLVTSFMPSVSFSAAANQEITIDTQQVIPVAYQKKSLTTSTTYTYLVRTSSASGYTLVDGAGKSVLDFTVSGTTATPKVIYTNIGTDKTWLDLALNYSTGNSGNSTYRYRIGTSTTYSYFRRLNVISNSYSAIGSHFEANDSGNIEQKNSTGRWVRGNIVLNNYYLKIQTNTNTINTWTNYEANTTVSAGDVIRFPSGYSYTWNYRYAHIGKQVTGKTTRRGSFNHTSDNIDQYNFSGNDLTEAKMDDLLEFARAGYPVILSKGCFNSDGAIDTTIIDKASNVYRLLVALTMDSDYMPSCFLETDTSRDSEFVDGLNNKSFRLIITEKPVEYVDRTKAGYAGYTDDRVYINGAADGSNSKIENRNLEFTFKVDTANTGYYEVRLFIDTNADGKFSEEEEKLDSLEIENVLTHRTTRLNRLVGGQTYHIVRQIKDYTGAIPWKLELVDMNNPLVRDDITGQCAIKVTAKTRINVMQIISDGMGGSYNPTVYFPTETEIALAKSNNGNREITDPGVNKDTYFNNCIRFVNSGSYVTDTDVIKNAGWFYYYTKILNEFEVVFYRLSVTEFSTLASTGHAPGDSTVYLQSGKCTYLTQKNINMLILGYADCYTDITNTAALQLIDGFISAGNTTLFTHDTTSFVNLSTKPGTFDDTYWGYNINQYFRDILGMDRFGVMTNMGLAGSLSSAPDKPYKVNTLQTSNTYYTASTTAMGTRVLTQGMTNVTVGQNGNRVTKAQKANNGQIVSYPYLIPDNLTVAETHSQYYQLDMEADDIVVWYTLSDTNDYYKTKNDVRNNYYIYNRSNITYSGVGHKGGLSDDERKLFVNTMIAAYSAGTVPTEPVIINKDRSSTGNNTDYLYIDYDATLDVGTAQPFGSEINSYVDGSGNTIYTKRIYFTLKNFSIIPNKKMTAHYYPVLVNTVGGVTTRTVLTEYPMMLNTYDYDRDIDVGTLVPTDTYNYNQTFSDGSIHAVSITGGLVQSTYEYYVDIPISDIYYKNLIAGSTDPLQNFALDSNSRFEIQLQVVMRYGRVEAANVPLVGKRNAIFVKRGMFTLD